MCCPPKQVDVVRLSHNHAAWRDGDAMSRVHECVGECVCVCPRVCLCVVCVSTDITFLTRTLLPTSGAGWCTQSPQTQTGRSSWPHHYNEVKRRVVSFQSPGDSLRMTCFKCELTHRQGWAEWAHWWTGRQSCPARIPLRCWAWREGRPASAPAEKTHKNNQVESVTNLILTDSNNLCHHFVSVTGLLVNEGFQTGTWSGNLKNRNSK